MNLQARTALCYSFFAHVNAAYDALDPLMGNIIFMKAVDVTIFELQQQLRYSPSHTALFIFSSILRPTQLRMEGPYPLDQMRSRVVWQRPESKSG